MDHALSNQRYVLLFLSCKERYCLSSFFLASNHCIRLVYFITYCISSLKISCKMLVVILVYEDYFRGEAKYKEQFICFLYDTAKLNESFCYSHRWLHHFLAYTFSYPCFPLTNTAPVRLQRSLQAGELVQVCYVSSQPATFLLPLIGFMKPLIPCSLLFP